MKRSAAVFLVGVILACFFGGCAKDPSAGQMFRYDILSEPSTLDPQTAKTETELLLLENTMAGLVATDEQGGVVAACAQEYDISADGLVYTFYLRDDLLWSDGKTPLTAADFRFGLLRLLDSATKSEHAPDYFCIENAALFHEGTLPAEAVGIAVLDRQTLQIRLGEANQFFLSLLAAPAAYPCNEGFFVSARGKYGVSHEFMLFNGPFAVTAWVENTSITIRKNAQYYDADAVSAAAVRFYKKDETDLSRILDGSVDAAAVDFSALAQLQEAGCETTQFESVLWAIIPGNLPEDSPLTNEKIRQALALATQRSALQNHLPDRYSLSGSLVPPSVTVGGKSYRQQIGDSGGLEEIPYAAKSLLQMGLGEISDDSVGQITLICPEKNGIPMLLSQLQRQWLDELGVFINIEPLSDEDLAAREAAGNFDLALLPFRAGYDSPEAVLKQFHPIDSPQLAATELLQSYLAQAKNTGDLSQVLMHYQNAERLLVGSGFVIPLFFETSCYASAEGVQNLRFSPFGCAVHFQFGRKNP